MIASSGPSPNRRKRENTVLMPCLFSSICSTVRSLRLSSLPDGSPTRVVPPPMSVIGLPAPVFWSQCSIMIESRCPTCSDSPVQS